MKSDQRLRAGSIALSIGILSLSAVSVGVLVPTPGLGAKVGWHLVAGALANFAFSLVLSVVAAIPLRQGHRWAFWAFLVPIAVYAVPILTIDAIYVNPENRLVTLAPGVAGVLFSVLCLAFVAPAIFSRPGRSSDR